MYEPRTEDAQAFVESLTTLTEEEWAAAEEAMNNSGVDRYEGPNAANFYSMAIASENGLWGPFSFAQIAARDAVVALGWEAETQERLSNAAHIAVGAIVVLDAAPVGSLAPAFVPFVHTSVNLPKDCLR